MGFEAILGFYYPKASLQRGADRSIRVKLTAEDSDLVIGADASVRVTDRATGVTLNWTGLGPQARVRLAPDGYLRIQYLAGSTWTDAQNPSWPDAKVAGPVVISGPESLWVSTADGSQRSYRGSLTMGRSGSTTQVVNTLGLEEYLYGVVPRESPSWFYPAALRAQAVAARSYASGACSGGDPNFDVLDTTSCQVYGGRAVRSNGRETSLETASAAVDDTRGLVLTQGGGVLRAEFSASNGGRTVASALGPARDDPYDGMDPRSGSAWQVTVPLSGLESLAKVGTVRLIRVTARVGGGLWGGRAGGIQVVGDGGVTMLTGSQVRSALGLRSDWFAFPDDVRPAGLVMSVTTGNPVTVASVVPSGHAEGPVSTADTALGVSDPGDWTFTFRGHGPRPDLVAVKERGTDSGFVEVHVLSGADGYRSFSMHAATPLPTAPDGRGWQFAVAGFAGSRDADLFAIRTGPSGSGRTEVHVLSAASGYRTWVAHTATALPTVNDQQVTMLIGDAAESGDLTAVMRYGTASGATEAHRLTRASGYQQFDLHAATALHTDPGGLSFDFGLAEADGDGTLDLYAIKRTATPSGRLEIHTLSGRTGFTSWLGHTETSAPASPGIALTVRQS